MDEFFLKKCLTLAGKGMGRTAPNPMVGAILVKNGRIIGKGYHKKRGLPHAEIAALRNCQENPAGTTLYVNLEPCSHFGLTPPCVPEIIKAEIKRVVCCSVDPNPKVSGEGVKALKKAGIEVLVGRLEDEAKALNEAFFTFHLKKRPFIAMKFAASLDGKIATYSGDSKWITNTKAREYARRLRAKYQAVLVGVNTVIKDDPHLGVRIIGKRDPVRIILGSKSKIPPQAQVLRDKNVIIAKTPTLAELLKILKQKEIISLLVEGGSRVLGSFLDERLVDKVYAFYSPILIGGEKAVTAIGGRGAATISEVLHLKNTSIKKFGDNFLITGYNISDGPLAQR